MSCEIGSHTPFRFPIEQFEGLDMFDRTNFATFGTFKCMHARVGHFAHHAYTCVLVHAWMCRSLSLRDMLPDLNTSDCLARTHFVSRTESLSADGVIAPSACFGRHSYD